MEGGSDSKIEEEKKEQEASIATMKKKKVDKRTQLELLPRDHRPTFIRKIYFLFTFAILIQLVYVLMVVKSKQNSELRKFASNYEYFIYAVITAIVATLLPVIRKNTDGVYIGACF